MSDISIGLSALGASQRGLDVVGENISNANTAGYHRQVLNQTEALPVQQANLLLGNGVDVNQIQRMRSDLLDTALTQNTSESSSTTAQLGVMQQAQTALTPGSGNLDGLLGSFFNQLDSLTTQPDDLTQRRVLLTAATSLTSQFNQLAGGFQKLSNGIDSQLQDLVGQANSLETQIAGLNQKIAAVQIQGINANDLQDQRDQLVTQLAQIVDVRTFPQANGVANVLAGGQAGVVGSSATTLQFSINSSGQAVISAAGSKTQLPITGGQLAGLLQTRNQGLASFTNQLDTLAQTLAQQVNEVHATGLGLSGPLTSVSGTQAVSSTTVPLAQAGLAFPAQAGSLSISVTNQATGNRAISQININPSTQSLQDLAATINASVKHIQAVVNSQTKTLQIIAEPGYAFDFAGRLAVPPDTVSITGTTTPTPGGTYTGTSNDVYTYRLTTTPPGGSGTIGVTPGLSLQVTNAAGNSVATLNVGQGYQPGTPLAVANGVTVQLSAGTANDGDNFSSRVIANPDTAGILSSLGLNSFFTGSSAATIAVQPTLVNDPSQLAASRTGQPGDSSNLQKISALQDGLTLGNGTQTFAQSFSAMVGDVGKRVEQLTQQQSTQKALGQQIEAQQQAVSGVDPNEELVHMLQYQRSFQMASEYINVVNTTLNSLLQLAGPGTGA
jgi:flagellar hook-associated protein 1 FlgK